MQAINPSPSSSYQFPQGIEEWLNYLSPQALRIMIYIAIQMNQTAAPWVCVKSELERLGLSKKEIRDALNELDWLMVLNPVGVVKKGTKKVETYTFTSTAIPINVLTFSAELKNLFITLKENKLKIKDTYDLWQKNLVSGQSKLTLPQKSALKSLLYLGLKKNAAQEPVFQKEWTLEQVFNLIEASLPKIDGVALEPFFWDYVQALNEKKSPLLTDKDWEDFAPDEQTVLREIEQLRNRPLLKSEKKVILELFAAVNSPQKVLEKAQYLAKKDMSKLSFWYLRGIALKNGF